MKHMKITGPAVVAAAVALTVIGSFAVHAHRQSGPFAGSEVVTASDHGGAAKTDGAAASAESVEIAALPGDVVRGLASQAVEVKSVATTATGVAEAKPSVDLSRAVQVGAAESGLAGSAVPSSAMLGRVTLTQYGQELQPDPSKPSVIDPIIEDRLAWVITYDSVPIRLYSPYGWKGPDHVDQPLVTFVDPTTGEFLAAISYEGTAGKTA
jgi:hypothetical protein